MSPQTKSLFSFPFTQFIWKMMVVADGSMLVLELRDESTRQVSFVGIDLLKHKIQWEQKGLPEKWWIGLWDTVEDKVLLHGYKDFQNPEHLGIYALDLKTGKLQWKNDRLASMIAGGGRIIARNPNHAGSYSLLQLSDGKQLKEFEEKVLEVESENLVQVSKAKVLYSGKYSTENIHFPKLSSFVELITGQNPMGKIEYLEFKEKIITSFYFKREENLVNYLLICDQEGNKILEEVIGENLKGIAEDSFFLSGGKVIFIKNRKELMIFEL